MTTTRNLILEHLQSGSALTGLLAFEKFRTLSLPQHIAALRGYGNDIDTEICKAPSGKTYAKLVLWCDKSGMTISSGVDLIVQEGLRGKQ